MIPVPGTVELGPFSSPGGRLTPWESTADALRRTQKFWLSTVRRDGRPHVTPLVAFVSLDGVCFVTGSAEQKSRNLHENNRVVLTTGVDTLTSNDIVLERVADLWRITPSTAFAHSDGHDFSPTRYVW